MSKENILIAEFMDYWSFNDGSPNKVPSLAEIEELSYDTSWKDLMPVVEKITQLGYHYSMDHGFPQRGKWVCKVYGTSKECNFSSDREEKPITATYTAVIQFIQWYNTQPTKQP